MTFNSDHHKLNQELQGRGAESGQLQFCDSSSPYAEPPYLVVLYCKHINLPVAISWNITCDFFLYIITAVANFFILQCLHVYKGNVQQNDVLEE
jgi:hypothetical protein